MHLAAPTAPRAAGRPARLAAALALALATPGVARAASPIPLDVRVTLGPTLAPGGAATATATVVARAPLEDVVLTWRLDGVASAGGDAPIALGDLAAGAARSLARTVVLPARGRGIVTADVAATAADGTFAFGRNASVWVIVDADGVHAGAAGFDAIERERLLASGPDALDDPAAARRLERALGAGAETTSAAPRALTPRQRADADLAARALGRAPGTAAEPPAAVGGTVSVWGSVQWKDAYGGTHPAPFVEVEVREAEAQGSELITTVVADSGGGFNVQIQNDDGPNQGGRDLFLRVHARALGNEVRAPGTTTPYFVESAVKNDVQDGIVLLGVTANATPDNNTAFGILALVTEGTLYAGHLTGGTMPAGVPIEFPVPFGSWLADGKIHIGLGDRYDADVILHEYGHWVQASFGITQSPGGDHGFFQNLAELHGKDVGVRLAWGEGWATFFAITCALDRALGDDRIPWAGDASYGDHEDANFTVSLEGTDPPDAGEDNELAVARIFYDLWDPREDNRDEVQIDEKVLFQTIDAADAGSLYAAWAALVAGKDTAFQAKLGAVFADHDVAPDPRSPDEGASPAGAVFRWKPNGAGPSFELNAFRVQFWSQDLKTKVFESPDLNAPEWTPTPADLQTIASLGAVWWLVIGTNTASPITGHYVSPARVIGGGSLGFVVDTSISMFTELPGVRTALRAVVDALELAGNPPTISVVPFTDFPGWSAGTADLPTVKASLDAMTPAGGDFCPEGSVEALLFAAATLQPGASMFLATDANPHPNLDLDGVIADLRAAGHEVNVLVSGRCTCECSLQSAFDLVPPAFAKPAPPPGPGDGTTPDDFGNDAAQAASIAPDGTPIDGWIATSGDQDWFAFPAVAGVSFAVEVEAPGNFDTVVAVYGPDGTTLLGEDDDGGPRSGSLLFFTPPADGIYFAKVRADFGQTGTYALTVDAGGVPSVDSLLAFSEIAAETGGVFVHAPVEFTFGGDETDAERRHRAAAFDLALAAFNPVVPDVRPASAPQGASLVLTLHGAKTHFGDGSTVGFSGAGITAGTPTVLSPRRLEVPVTLAPGAVLGFSDVTVSTPQPWGTELAVGHDAFRVTAAPAEPTVTAVVPATLRFGESAAVRVFGAGTHFDGGSVADLGAHVTVDDVVAVSETELRLQVTVEPDVDVLGLHDVTVTTGAETASESVGGPLLVVYPLAERIPRITGVAPADAVAGASATLTVTGVHTAFADGETTAAFAPAGVGVDAVRVLDATTVEIDVTVDGDAVPGPRKLTVAAPDGTAAGLGLFTVLPDPDVPPVPPATLVVTTTTATSSSTTSAPTTTSPSTTSGPPATVPPTTTTLPPPAPTCAQASDCEDGDTCTVDGCAAGGCTRRGLTGFDGVLCAFLRRLDDPACAGDAVPAAVGKHFAEARSLVEGARDARSAKKARRLLGKARGRLAKGLRMIDGAARRRKKGLSGGCAAALRGLVGDAKARVEAARLAPPA